MADHTLWSRVIHACPSFALMGAYELLMREFRIDARGVRTANAGDEQTARAADVGPFTESEQPVRSDVGAELEGGSRPTLRVVEATGEAPSAVTTGPVDPSEGAPQIQIEAWHWALDNRREDGALPTGREIAVRFDHKERWGRLIKQWGQQGRFDTAAN